jgi:gallate dioxygenase
LNAFAPSCYPTTVRATGVSWMQGIGRFGSIFGSFAGGVLLSLGWGFSAVIAILAIPATIAALSIVFTASRRAPKQSPDRISTVFRNSIMANIIGAIASSHTPTIGFALDANKQHDAVWAPIFKAYEPVRQWLAEKKPDVLVMIYNDHVTSFFFDHYSAFALGIGKEWRVADEGGGARDLPPVIGHAGLARHIGESLVADEFDMSFFQDKPLDHGCFSPLSIMWPQEEGAWPGTIVPLQCGVLQFPVPSARRCFKLGQALRRAIESYPEDLDVAIVATGGLSHQVHGERCGFNNPEWDHAVPRPVREGPGSPAEHDPGRFRPPGRLGERRDRDVDGDARRHAGRLNCLHREYYLPSMTGIAVAVYESPSRL